MTKDEKTVSILLSGRAPKKYEGKQVIVCDGKVYILPRDDKKSKEFLNKLVKNNPNSRPTITFVPRHGTYILVSRKE